MQKKKKKKEILKTVSMRMCQFVEHNSLIIKFNSEIRFGAEVSQSH